MAVTVATRFPEYDARQKTWWGKRRLARQTVLEKLARFHIAQAAPELAGVAMLTNLGPTIAHVEANLSCTILSFQDWAKEQGEVPLTLDEIGLLLATALRNPHTGQVFAF